MTAAEPVAGVADRAAAPVLGSARGASRVAFAMVLVAASCWGTQGTAYALILCGVAISPVTLVLVRAISAFAALLAFALVCRRDLLRVRVRDLPFLACFGFVTITALYVALIYAFALTGVAIGTILLYLAPAIVAVASALALGEPLTRRKVVALALCLAGAALVVEPWRGAGSRASGVGVALGLVSAACYAAYSVLGKAALRRHHPLTLLLYALGFGCVGLVPFQVVAGSAFPSGWALLTIALTTGGLVTLLPMALYTTALRALPSSVAAILATFEPVVAIALAAVVLGQLLTTPQLAGAAAIVGGVVVLAGRRPGSPSPSAHSSTLEDGGQPA